MARHLAELQGVASRRGWPFEISSDAADLTARARRAAADGVERLLVAGGDGTVHWSLQGLAGSETALAVVPMGSGNDIASVLGFGRHVEQCAEAADGAPIREAVKDVDISGVTPWE